MSYDDLIPQGYNLVLLIQLHVYFMWTSSTNPPEWGWAQALTPRACMTDLHQWACTNECSLADDQPEPTLMMSWLDPHSNWWNNNQTADPWWCQHNNITMATSTGHMTTQMRWDGCEQRWNKMATTKQIKTNQNKPNQQLQEGPEGSGLSN